MKDIRRIWLVKLKDGKLYCALCGELIRARKDLNADHRIPKSLGGKTDNDNLQPAHKWCNEARGNMWMEDWKVRGYSELKGLVDRWKKNKTRYNKTGVRKSLIILKKKFEKGR